MKLAKLPASKRNPKNAGLGLSKSLLLLVCAIQLSCGDSEVRPSESCERPNFVIVLVDAMRRDHLGLYGYGVATSPNLDRYAQSSVVFENAYSHGSHTIVSTASLLTSRVFSQILFVDPPKTEPSGHTTARVKKGKKLKILVPRGPSLPEVFSGAGYRSFAVLTNPHHHEESGFPDLFDEAIVLIGGSESNSAVPYHDAQTVADEFLSWLKTRRDTDSPFLAYVHFMDPHNPYSAPDRFRSRYVTAEGRDRYINGIPSDQQSPSAQDLEFMRQNYDAEIAYFDETFSTLVGKTREVVNRPTVFVVTSDHGEEFMDHGGLGHGQTLHKEQVWVPLIFIGTQRNPARDHRLARHIDIAPTLAGIAGVDPDGSWEGRDLFGTVGASQDLLQEGASVAYSHHGIWSLTTDRWHYSINRRSGEHWLSDNLEDASGTENLAQLREDVVSELTLQMVPYRKSWRESQERVKVLQQRFRVNPANSDRDQVLENLRQLGYVE